jgi:hypothetical protein
MDRELLGPRQWNYALIESIRGQPGSRIVVLSSRQHRVYFLFSYGINPCVFVCRIYTVLPAVMYSLE